MKRHTVSALRWCDLIGTVWGSSGAALALRQTLAPALTRPPEALGLTGAGRGALHAFVRATQRLINAAGNFYINDKPTGAVVGQQPFGGARASGTNDKAGSAVNLHRWISQRAIKEVLSPRTTTTYPYMIEK